MASNGTPASPRRSARLAGQVAAAAADGDAAPARSSGPLATLLDFVLLRRPVPPSALANLKNYKYAAVDYSVLSKYVLKPYWTWLLQFMPMWLAPNMITLIGLLFILGNCGLVVAFDGYLEGTGPGWLYLSLAFGLFAYQSMDNIDGGQARRTGSSSPLGELFDHGCDALNATFGTILQASAMGLGFTWRTLLLVLLTTVPFYFSTAEEFHTKMMYFGVINGPVEGVLIGIGLMIVSGTYGTALWKLPLATFFPSLGLPSWMITTDLMLFPMLALMLFFHVPLCIINLYRSLPADIKKSPLRSIGLIIWDHIPLVLFHAACSLWVLSPGSRMLDSGDRKGEGLLFWLASVGMVFGRVCTEIIECYVTQMPFPWWRMTRLSVPFWVGAVCVWLYPQWTYEVPYLQLLCVWSLAMYLRWATGTIQDFCGELGIYCLRIPGPGKKKTT